MDEIKLKKPIEEVRYVLKHYLNNGHKFTDTPPISLTYLGKEHRLAAFAVVASSPP